MFRINVFLLALCIFLGLGVFHIKYEVVAVKTKFSTTSKAIEKAQENIHILKAEWTHLNHPDRIERLARKYINFDTLTPQQVISFSDLKNFSTKVTTPIKATTQGQIKATTQSKAPSPQVKKKTFKNIGQLLETLDHQGQSI